LGFYLIYILKYFHIYLYFISRDMKQIAQLVTAAYVTIMYRLGVIVTRLSSAAFWLEVWEIDDIVCARRTGDST
jgi:hypothetical protein